MRPGDGFSLRRYASALIAIWLLCIFVMLAVSWTHLVHFELRDPDDAMRLVQVRDLMAGQNWFDTIQHRVNPPIGGMMHWSRLVDMPIALLIILARPFASQSGAELVALITIPLLLSAALFIITAETGRRLGGVRLGLACAAMLALSLTVLIQFLPLRIDHHGWQIVLAAVAATALLDSRPLRSGVISGTATALWLTISGEALPYAALLGFVTAVPAILRKEEWSRPASYLSMLTIVSTALLIATRPWAEAAQYQCDTMSPAYLLPLAAANIAFLGTAPLGRSTLLARCAPSVTAGCIGIAAFLAIAPECTQGPFQALEPIVRDYWYLQVLEGMPINRQDPAMIAMIVGISSVGLIGYAWRLMADDAFEIRRRWMTMAMMAAGTSIISILVMRAMSVAHLYALPGIAWLLLYLHDRASRLTTRWFRIPAIAALVALTPVGIGALAALLPTDQARADEPSKAYVDSQCDDPSSYRVLKSVPAETLLAPLDIGPAILMTTNHSVVATSHHRNHEAMADLIKAFIGSDRNAHEVMAAHHARYVLLCPTLNEIRLYARINPNGFAAHLTQNQIPHWLVSVNLGNDGPLRLYRIRPE